jgi:hypothetical protein
VGDDELPEPEDALRIDGPRMRLARRDPERGRARDDLAIRDQKSRVERKPDPDLTPSHPAFRIRSIRARTSRLARASDTAATVPPRASTAGSTSTSAGASRRTSLPSGVATTRRPMLGVSTTAAIPTAIKPRNAHPAPRITAALQIGVEARRRPAAGAEPRTAVRDRSLPLCRRRGHHAREILRTRIQGQAEPLQGSRTGVELPVCAPHSRVLARERSLPPAQDPRLLFECLSARPLESSSVAEAVCLDRPLVERPAPVDDDDLEPCDGLLGDQGLRRQSSARLLLEWDARERHRDDERHERDERQLHLPALQIQFHRSSRRCRSDRHLRGTLSVYRVTPAFDSLDRGKPTRRPRPAARRAEPSASSPVSPALNT